MEEQKSDDHFAEQFEADLNRIMAKVSPHYNRAGEQISFTQWCHLLTTIPDYCHIAKDVLTVDGQEMEVCTDLIGMPQPHGIFTPEEEKAKLLIFETMIFFANHNGTYAHRYATEAEAVAGHKEIVSAIKDGRPIPLEDQGLDAKMYVLGKVLGMDLKETNTS